MGGELVVVGAGELRDEFFELRGSFQVDKHAAFDADEVMMMGFEGVCELVALFEADLHDIDDTEFRKELERPVDARTLCELARFENLL